MARIRSIKPSYWTDPKINKLSGNAALFFIAIWNFCDDLGYFDCTASSLSLLVPRFKPQAVQPMLSTLEKLGLVVCSRVAGVGLVVGWRHQRIDKPQASKYEGQTFQWDTESDSKNVRERSKNVPRKDRIGEDRIYISQTPSPSVPCIPKESGNGIGAKDLVELWNSEKHSELPSVEVITPKRDRSAKAILKKYPEKEFWEELIREINKSDFCIGNVPVSGNRTKPWRVSFDWILKEDNIVKIIEGAL